MKGFKYIFLLLCGLFLGCSERYEVRPVDSDAKKLDFSIQIKSKYRTLDCRLAVNDSLMYFYPNREDTVFYQCRRLEAGECDSIKNLAQGVLNRFGYDAIEGNFRKDKAFVDFEIAGYRCNGYSRNYSPYHLSRYLMSLVPKLPGLIGQAFAIPSNASGIYNDGSWAEIELQLLYTYGNGCFQKIIISPDSIIHEMPGNLQLHRRCGLSNKQRTQLTEVVKMIDLNADFVYWTDEPVQIEDLADEGLRLMINKKEVAAIYCSETMPTRGLQELYALICEMSPYPLQTDEENFISVNFFDSGN